MINWLSSIGRFATLVFVFSILFTLFSVNGAFGQSSLTDLERYLRARQRALPQLLSEKRYVVDTKTKSVELNRAGLGFYSYANLNDGEGEETVIRLTSVWPNNCNLTLMIGEYEWFNGYTENIIEISLYLGGSVGGSYGGVGASVGSDGIMSKTVTSGLYIHNFVLQGLSTFNQTCSLLYTRRKSERFDKLYDSLYARWFSRPEDRTGPPQ